MYEVYKYIHSMNYTTHIALSAKIALIAAFVLLFVGIAAFFALEPSVGRAITDNFTVTQVITDEISFTVAADDVTMVGSIQGLTGGYSEGDTVAVVRTNDAQGYTMQLKFATTTSGHAMQASSTAWINDYTPATPGTADFLWVDNAGGGASEFGYTVLASTTGQVDLAFRDDGAGCGAGSNETADRCWLNPTTTPQTIIATAGPTAGSTSTIKFKVAVPNSPSPALPTGNYVATGILTATNNP